MTWIWDEVNRARGDGLIDFNRGKRAANSVENSTISGGLIAREYWLLELFSGREIVAGRQQRCCRIISEVSLAEMNFSVRWD